MARRLAIPILGAIIVASLAGLTGCGRGGGNAGRHAAEGSAMVDRPPITDVLARHTPRLMAIPGVTGTYEGAQADGSPCIGILVVRLTPSLRDSLPRELEGWPVRVEESGRIKPMGAR